MYPGFMTLHDGGEKHVSRHHMTVYDGGKKHVPRHHMTLHDGREKHVMLIYPDIKKLYVMV